MPLLIISSILFLLFFPAYSLENPPTNPAPVNFSCDSLTNSRDCAARIEKQQLPRFRTNVKREGGSLIFKLKSGNTCALANDTVITADAVWYHFRDYYPELGYFVVHAQFHEGDGFMLIHDVTARSTHIIGAPLVSPDKSRFIAVSEDLESGSNPNQIQIYRVSGNELVKEFEHTPHNWGPRNPAWLGNDKISFEKHVNKYDPILNTWKSGVKHDTLTQFGNRWMFMHE